MNHNYSDKESFFIEKLKCLLINQHIVEKEDVNVEYPLSKNDNGIQYRADIYLNVKSISLKCSDGNVKKIDGPIALELKRQLQFDTVSRYLRLHKQLQPFNNYKNFILIYFIKNDFSKNLPEIPPGLNFYVYQGEDILNGLKDNKQKSYKLEGEKGDNEETEDWKVKREQIIESAKTDFNQGKNISFFIGAGVSIASGLPGWNTLLERMLSDNNFHDHLNGNDLNRISDNCGSSSIVLGRFIKSYYERHDQQKLSKERYIDIIHDALYKDFNKNFESPLITQLMDLIKTGNITEIITYNFDSILETYLEKEKIKYYPVFNNNAPQAGLLPVYHVHGFIPMGKGRIDTPMPVLSEEQYHEVYANAYNWGNVEQLHALNRTTCFFVGLSMNDPNLRRILEISHNEADEQTRHYVFLVRQQNFDTEKKNKCFQYVQTAIFENLGLNVIWYDKHEDLPDLLSQLIK